MTELAKLDVVIRSAFPNGRNPLKGLTDIDHQVLVLLIEKYTEKEIGAILKWSRNKVHAHARRVFVRLGVSSRQELMSVLSKGLIALVFRLLAKQRREKNRD